MTINIEQNYQNWEAQLIAPTGKVVKAVWDYKPIGDWIEAKNLQFV